MYENMHTITWSDQGEKFYVRVPKDDGISSRDYIGNAFLHVSGALFIEPVDGEALYYGPGRWHAIHLGERPKTPMPPMPRAI